jgi:hypothetical protein
MIDWGSMTHPIFSAFGVPGAPFSSLSPSLPGVASSGLDDATRKIALGRTLDTLRELEKIRKLLELPVELLPQILEVYASSSREAVLEKERIARAERSDRLPATMTSASGDCRWLSAGGERLCAPASGKLTRGMVVEVVIRPQRYAYRVEEIEINGDPSRWIVRDIKVGKVSQTMNAGKIPGERFRKGGIMSELRLTTCLTAMDFVLDVEYVGPLPEGEVFSATLVGTAVTF